MAIDKTKLTVIRVTFCSGTNLTNEYDYFVPSWLKHDFKPGGYAIVRTGGRTDEGPKLVKIHKIFAPGEDGHLAERISVCGTVDLSQFEEKVAIVERRVALLSALNELEKKRKALQAFEALAATDPEARKLLNELKRLDKEDTEL